MRKQKSIRWFRYTVEDAKAAQAELDEQAERGWELEEVGLFTATFRRAERPRRCWVEPARWKSERKKDWDARSDYLTLCGEAGWELLEEDGDSSISAIAEAVGFHSFSHFCVCFRKATGQTPSAYRRDRLVRAPYI